MARKKIVKSEEGGKSLIKPINLIKDKKDRQIMWALILMISVILIIVLIPIVKHYFFDKFTYEKLEYQKTQMGDMKYFSTRIPVTDSSYAFIGTFDINFRNDPRKLEDINTTIKTGIPTFNKKETVYISTGKMERSCIDGTAAVLTLAGFLRGFAGMNLTGALSDKELADSNNFPYVTCENSKMNTVINLVEGNKTEITQINSNCYILEYKDCEVMKVSEKFILEILKGYMVPFSKK